MKWADSIEEESEWGKEEEVQGVDECRETKLQRDLRQLEEKRRAKEEAAEGEWHEPR